MGLLLRWSLYQAQVKARGQSGRLWDKSVAEPALSAAHTHHCDLMRAHGMCIYIYGYGSIPIDTIFSGMNIHLPAILGFTRYQGFDQ